MNKNSNKIEIFGKSDLPSRSGTFISTETFKECLKKDAPIPVTVNGEEVGYIAMRNATPEENEGINNYIKSISEPLYTKDDVIKEIEDIRKETKAYVKAFESAFGDPFSMLYLLRYIDEDINNRISKLKGKNNG